MYKHLKKKVVINTLFVELWYYLFYSNIDIYANINLKQFIDKEEKIKLDCQENKGFNYNQSPL